MRKVYYHCVSSFHFITQLLRVNSTLLLKFSLFLQILLLKNMSESYIKQVFWGEDTYDVTKVYARLVINTFNKSDKIFSRLIEIDSH